MQRHYGSIVMCGRAPEPPARDAQIEAMCVAVWERIRSRELASGTRLSEWGVSSGSDPRIHYVPAEYFDLHRLDMAAARDALFDQIKSKRKD